jgi:hypothetical protein
MLPSLVSLFKLTVEVSTINLKTAKDAWSCRAFAPAAIPCIIAAICEARVRAVLVAGSGCAGLRRKSGMDDGNSTINEEKQRCSLP